MPRRSLLALLAVLVLAGAACGGGDDGDDVTSGGPTTSVAADVTDEGANEGADDPEDDAADGTGDDDGVDTDPAVLPDPCSFWTRADLEAVIGITFEEGAFNETLSVNGQEICDWLTPDADPIANAQTLVHGNPASFDPTQAGATGIEISGADDAYAIMDGNIIAMLVGEFFVQVAYIPASPADTTAELSELAEIAVGNI